MTDKERLDLMMATNLSEIVKKDFLKWLAENGFFIAPASTKYHGNYEGGLFDHSFMVMNLLVELSAANGLKWKRPESPFLVGMFHDLCKIDQYKHPATGMAADNEPIYDPIAWEYNNDRNSFIESLRSDARVLKKTDVEKLQDFKIGIAAIDEVIENYAESLESRGLQRGAVMNAILNRQRNMQQAELLRNINGDFSNPVPTLTEQDFDAIIDNIGDLLVDIYTAKCGAYLHFTVVLNDGGKGAQSRRNGCSICAVEVRNLARNTHIIVVLPDVFLGGLSVADLLAVFCDKAHIQIVNGGTEYRLILIVAGAFCIHKLQAFIKVQLL